MIQLLFVEDDVRSIRHARQKVEELHNDVTCVVKNFGEARDWMTQNSPDIVSLDLLLDGLSGDAQVAGQPIYEYIWQDRFCPVIIYSAQPDAEDDGRPAHPFLATIKKGTGSPLLFSNAVDAFRPHIDAIRNAETQVRREFTLCMRTVAPFVFGNVTDASERAQMVTRSGCRRLAAQMDNFTDYAHGGEALPLASWEHYLCPPVDANFLLGDVLCKKDADCSTPTEFRVILTPSCDLVETGGRKPKVSNVLVAKCFGMREALAAVGMTLRTAIKNDDQKLLEYKKSLKMTMLSQSFFRNIFPFPPFAGVLPAMAANLKELDLIPFEEIKTQYKRVCSLDSPFREVVSWAYMQTGCRPGLPDRELDQWVEEIVTSHG